MEHEQSTPNREENTTRNTKGAANKAHTCCCGVDGSKREISLESEEVRSP